MEEINVVYSWVYEESRVDWDKLSELYRIAPLGNILPSELQTAFTNSRYKCFVFDGDLLIAAGRALADGVDSSYICDVAVHPDYQGKGLGTELVRRLLVKLKGYRKIILFSVPGKERFYKKLGFDKMNTAMAIFKNQEAFLQTGILSKD